MDSHFGKVYSRRTKLIDDFTTFKDNSGKHIDPSCPRFGKFYVRRKQRNSDISNIHANPSCTHLVAGHETPPPTLVIASETPGTTSRRATRQRRIMFDSLVIPVNRIGSRRQANIFPYLHVVHLNRRPRAARSRRTCFTSLLMPTAPVANNRRRIRQAIDTERRREARANQTDAQRSIVGAVANARRRQARAVQTDQQRENALTTDNFRRSQVCRRRRLNHPSIETTSHSASLSQEPLPLSNAQYFRKSCRELLWVSCSVCRTSFPGFNNAETCAHCSREISHGQSPLKFSAENLMDPGVVPIELSRLTNLEQILIARVHPMMSVYRVRGQQYKYSGNVINFLQDVNSIATVLPIRPTDLSAILIVNRTGSHATKEFRVRREYVREALVWLKHNHIYYRDITIAESSLQSLPLDGVPEDIPCAHDDIAQTSEEPRPADEVEIDVGCPPETVDQHVHIDEFHAVGTISIGQQPNQEVCIQRALHVADVDYTTAYMHMTNQVIDEFSTPGYISMVFPTLFPYGTADFRQARPRKLDPAEYFQFLMKYRDGRFAQDSRFRYFAWNSMSRWRALALGDVYIRKNPTDAELTIQDIQQMVASGDKQLATRISYYAKSIRGTRAYWYTRMQELITMVTQLGAPTIFFTLSAADLQWPELYNLLDPSLNSNIQSDIDLRKRRAKLLNENPCIVAWFFQTRVELFFKYFLLPEFDVIDFWYRFEWQHRGSGHVHGFLWIKDAPDVARLTTSEEDRAAIIEYFDRLICTENPDTTQSIPLQEHPCAKVLPMDLNLDSDDSDYASMVNWVMCHSKCGKYCLHLHKTTRQKVCQFRYPFDVAEPSSIVEEPPNSNMFRFLGRRNDPLVCSHNRKVLQSWRANIDWSPVLSVQTVTQYIAKYAAKAEPASKTFTDTLRCIIDDLRRPCPSARSAVKHLLIKSVSERDVSAQEVCHLLMGYSLARSSRKFVLLNVSEKSILSSTLRRCHSENTEDVGTDPSFVVRYMARPPDYEELSLLQMAKKHYFSRNQWHKSQVEAIVRVIPQLQRKEVHECSESWDQYCRQQVLLHHHYRNLDEAKGECDTWSARCCDLGLASNDTVIVNESLNEEFEEEESDVEVEDVARDEWMVAALMGPTFDPVDDIELGLREIDTSHNWEEGLLRYPNIDVDRKFVHNNLGVVDDVTGVVVNNSVVVPLTNLSAQQRMAHDLVLRSLHGQVPIHLIISGGAGTGKSTLIFAIVQSAFNLFRTTRSVRIMAPTGVVAFNVSGSTIHHELYINAERKPSQSYIPITGDQCRRMQEDFKDTKLIIIDEYSMVGRAMLANIDLHCRDIFAKNEPFGGVSIVLVGDMRQLPPVFYSPLYSGKGNYMQQRGTLAYAVFEKCVRLSHIFRQAGEGQASFREALHRLSDGTSTIDDWQMFKTRDYSILSPAEIDNFKYSLRLFPTRQAANAYNRERLVTLGRPIARIVSKNNCELATRTEADHAKGLEKILCISVGARVMLRANMATHNGLVNGAMGTVTDIVYGSNCKSPCDIPLAIMVDFDNYRGAPFREGTNVIPIPPVTSNWKTSNGITCQRTQIPIVLCWAITIHKSQGLTLDKAVVDIGDRESLGLTFVALSRTRRLQDLAFNPMFTFERLQKIGNCEGLKGRRQEEERLITMDTTNQ